MFIQYGQMCETKCKNLPQETLEIALSTASEQHHISAGKSDIHLPWEPPLRRIRKSWSRRDGGITEKDKQPEG